MANSIDHYQIERRFLSDFYNWDRPAAYNLWSLVRRAAHKHAESIRTPARAAGLLQSAERITAKLTRLIPQVKELR